jgi:hypothetical protein
MRWGMSVVDSLSPIPGGPQPFLGPPVVVYNLKSQPSPCSGRLANPVMAIILSVTAVLFFGEIVPQSICTR